MACHQTRMETPQSIFDLKFSSSHPHFLASASLDKTVRFWNPVLASGSDLNALVRQKDLSSKQSKSEGQLQRKFVRGELVGLSSDEGHEGGVLSIVGIENFTLFGSRAVDQ